MSEANYPFSPLEMLFRDNTYLAQTFIPLESHDCKYVSLKLRFSRWAEYVEVALQYTFLGEPTGVDLVKQTIDNPHYRYTEGLETYLVRWYLPWRLVAGTEYAIVLREYAKIALTEAYIAYEPPPGHYPRGKLIKSNDGGVTWDTTDLGDMFFAEWGDPPVKPSPVDPPLSKFAILDCTYLHLDNALIIYLPTNVPCHLTCYYTDQTPLKHHRSRTIRGTQVPWGTYFCFVAWKHVEQLEFSSTLYHTFIIPDWLPGQIQWFTFRGEVDFIESPSVGPIFQHTHPGQDLIANPSFEVFTDPPNPPDQWRGEISPGTPPDFQPWPTDKTHGRQSCKSTVNHIYALMNLYQNLTPSHLSDLQLSFLVSYNGALEWFNGLRIRAWGDTFRLVRARPTLDYQWEDLTATITMPSNLYRLELKCITDNQGQPVPWSALWDNCRVYLGLPP